MAVEIWVAIIGLVGVVFTATIGLFTRHIRKMSEDYAETLEKTKDIATKQALQKDREAFHAQVTSPYYPVKEWTRFVHRVEDLCAQTEVDRVLVLVAVNGIDQPNNASVIWEYRATGGRFDYIDVPLDSDYVSRLRHIKSGKLLRFKTSDVNNTLIGGYYQNEGVTESVWAMIGQKVSITTEQVAYKYCSIATHNESGFSDPKEIEREIANLVADYRRMMHVAGFTPM